MEEEFSFRGQRSDENVVLVVKCHPWGLTPILWYWLIAITVLIITLYFFGASVVTSYLIFIILAVGGFYSFYVWFIWNNGFYIITSQRVIRIDQRGLFNRRISEAENDKIQEISTDIKGPIKTMLNFGDVRLQTASRDGRLVLAGIASPYDIQQRIAQIQYGVNSAEQPQKNPSPPRMG